MDEVPDQPLEDEAPTPPYLVSEVQASAFLGLIRAGAALERALDNGLVDEHRLGLHQFEVLLFLAGSPPDNSLPMAELRRRSPLSQSRVSRVVVGLEAQGLVRRETDPTDNRSVTVVLTERGEEAFNAAWPRHRSDLHEYLFSLLTEVEIRQLASITNKLLASERYHG